MINSTVPIARWLSRTFDVEGDEAGAVVAGFIMFFLLFAGYFMLRPVRETMGITGGVDNLQWLFTATFFATLAAMPLFGWIAARVRRRRILYWVFGFFAANLAVFGACFLVRPDDVWIARTFYVWLSVFNLIAISVAWSVLVDVFAVAQAKRLFALMAAGASLGGLTGPLLGVLLIGKVGHAGLVLLSAALLVASAFAARSVQRWRDAREESTAAQKDIAADKDMAAAGRNDSPSPSGGRWREAPDEGLSDEAISLPSISSGTSSRATPDEAAHVTAQPHSRATPLGGSPFAGATEVLRSPFLLGIAVFMLLLASVTTFLYFEQARLVEARFPDSEDQTRVFGIIDIVVQSLAILSQLFLTGRIAQKLGIGVLLVAVPLLAAAGFLWLAFAPTFAVLAVVMVVRRAGEYAFVRPGREMLYTVVPTEAKYKAKNFNDTVVYRGADAVSGWVKAGIDAISQQPTIAMLLGAVIALVWGFTGGALARKQRKLESGDIVTAAS